MNKIKSPSEKSFGITFSIIFLFINGYFYITSGIINYLLLIVSILLIIISIFLPGFLKIPNFLWFKFGILLSKIMTPVILSLVFYFVVTPIGILYRIFNKKKRNSTWQDSKIGDKTDFTKQF